MSMLQYSLRLNCLALDFDVIKTALLNTVIGMGTVFVVLILISFLISLFAFIPKLQEKFRKGDRSQEVTVAQEKSEEPVVEEELADDTELVAVITAAIMASMGDEAPSDGLVVRSIRRVNRKRFA